MELRLLGPVEVRAAGQLVDAGSPRQRCVLAALAADAGRTVLVGTLVERVWGGAAPARAREALYAYIARVRKMIDQAGGGHYDRVELLRRSKGYLLDIAPERVDVHRFRGLIRQAREPACTEAERADLLRQALDLWQGPPVGDLSGEWAARVAAGWQQQRLEAAADWAWSELRLGNAGAVVDRLTELVGEFPFAESLVALQMRALSAAGHGVEALRCYRRTRSRLMAEMGVEPGDDLQSLHLAMLRGDPVGVAS